MPARGDPRHIDTAVRLLAHKAKLNGYAVEPEQVSGSGGTGLNIILHLGNDAQSPIPTPQANGGRRG